MKMIGLETIRNNLKMCFSKKKRNNLKMSIFNIERVEVDNEESPSNAMTTCPNSVLIIDLFEL